MTLKFKDLYDSMRNTEFAFTRMGVDIDNAKCGMPKCILTNSQENLLESYMELANQDINFCELNFSDIIQRIVNCVDCVTDEFRDLVPPPLPPPAETVDNCRDTMTTVIPLEHIKRFRIYERTYTSPTIPSAVQVYVIEKANLPNSFEPSVPTEYSSFEKYTVGWNKERQSLSIKVDHSKFPDSMGAPDGSFNVSLVIAEYVNEVANTLYEGYEISACTAMVMTPGISWKTDHGIDKSIDGDFNTYPSYDGTPQECIVEYQFKTG